MTPARQQCVRRCNNITLHSQFFAIVTVACIPGLFASQTGSHKRGCTAPSLLSHKPFLVVWNHPSQVCERHGVDIDFTRWGIAVNSDNFIGEKISLLYRPGKWPYYFKNVSYNGGIPQLGNKTLHIHKLKDVIGSNVPNHNFSGLGVIDFERWRPLYSLNFDKLKIYQEKSLEYAKQKHPKYNKSQILSEAVREFEQAARSYIEDSLKTVTTLRPDGQWGYYGYPRCWDANCNGTTISINDRMSWVFASSTGLYPSIYFHQSTPLAEREDMITNRLLETLRVRAKWAPTDAAIFPYSLNQDGPYSFFSMHDLDYSIKLPADMGSSGVLLWGSSAMASAKKECLLLQSYVSSTLGPYSKQVMDFFSNCSTLVCSGHGRCVRKDYETVYQNHLAHRGQKECGIPQHRLRMSLKSLKRTGQGHKLTNLGKMNNQKSYLLSYEESQRKVRTRFLSEKDFDDYICKCFAGWSGSHCSVK